MDDKEIAYTYLADDPDIVRQMKGKISWFDDVMKTSLRKSDASFSYKEHKDDLVGSSFKPFHLLQSPSLKGKKDKLPTLSRGKQI